MLKKVIPVTFPMFLLAIAQEIAYNITAATDKYHVVFVGMLKGSLIGFADGGIGVALQSVGSGFRLEVALRDGPMGVCLGEIVGGIGW